MKKNKKIKNNRGFTLVELMFVIVIIGILASIGIPKYQTATTRAKVVEFKLILEQIYSLEENYYAEFDKYSSDFDDLGFDDPKAKYFEFSIESDSTTFTAYAKCIANLKTKKGSLKGQSASIDQDGERGGDMGLMKISRW